MAVYHWQGVSPKGETLKGEMEATSREAVIIRLRTQRIQPNTARIKEKGKGLDFEIRMPAIGSEVKTRDIVIFTRQFATMIDAGLPIMQCLHILAAQTDSKAFRKVLGQVKDDVEAGTTLADSIRKHPKVFSDLFTSLVQAGEIGGILDTILVRLANYLEKAAKLKSKIKGAMIYPTCIVAAAILVTTILMVWVFPPMVCQMIAVGETTGALDSMLQKIADFYEDEVDNTVANLMSLLEPAVILFLGVVIGGLVISMYLPIFQLGAVME